MQHRSKAGFFRNGSARARTLSGGCAVWIGIKKQLRTAANTVRQEKQAQQAARRTQTILRHARQTAREGVETAQKAATVLHSAIRHLLAALQSLAAALIAGGWIAVFIVLLICLIALVAGSAYGIFFAAETPDENAISVTQLFGGNCWVVLCREVGMS